jgi:hypothetical protein
MNRSTGVLIVTAMLAWIDNSAAAEFQVKGLKLGLTEEQACGSSPVVRHQETLEATGVTGLDFPATGCQLNFDSVAGIRPSGPARLLFWKGRLIRVIVEFERLELSDAAALRVAFMDLHGKPASRRSPPFRTDIWRTGKQKLELEWSEGLPTNVGVYMTDELAWAEYQRVQQRASNAVEALEKKRRSEDVVR